MKGKRGDSNDPNTIPNREARRSDPKSKIKALLYFVSGISISTSSPGYARKGFLTVRTPFDWLCPMHKLLAEQFWQDSMKHCTSTWAISSSVVTTIPLSLIFLLQATDGVCGTFFNFRNFFRIYFFISGYYCQIIFDDDGFRTGPGTYSTGNTSIFTDLS